MPVKLLMYSTSQLAFRWFQYQMRASNSRGHGIHSPFVYQLIREVFNDHSAYDAYTQIENIKRNLLKNNRIIEVADFGAGSGVSDNPVKKISDIAKNAVSDRKFGRLLFRLAKYYHAEKILELGTSLGISTAYLASASAGARVTTLEGSPVVAAIAGENFKKLKLQNISQVTCKFEDGLPAVFRDNDLPDLIFIDGNHRKKPVLDYFEQCIEKIAESSLIIIHDIHWSEEMEEAWSLIQQHQSVQLSVDIFSAGLIFFRKEFQVKQHFIIRF